MAVRFIKMKVTKKGCLLYGCLSPVVAVVLIVLGVLIVDKVVPSKARRALPDSASDVQEYYHDCLFPPDFVRVIKARLPEEDFQQYARNLGLTMKYDPNIHGSEYDHVKMLIGSVPDWWDEPRDLDNCYFKHTPGDEYFTRAKWKDGFVYFVAIAW